MTFIEASTKALLAMMAAAPTPKVYELDPAQTRMMYRTLAAMVERPAPPLARKETLRITGRGGAIALRLYDPDPKVTTARPVMMYFHGGGWVIGDLDSHDSLCATLARELSMRVVAVDYRLAPEHPFPAAVDDCEDAVQWVAGSPPELGGPVSAFILAGDSAGGNLAAVLAQQAAWPVPVAAQLLLYPVTDFQATGGSMLLYATGYVLEKTAMEWFLDQYAPLGLDRADPRLSPLNGALAGVAPAVVVTAGLDPLQDQGSAYARALEEAGVTVIHRHLPGHVHGCFTMRQAIPAAQDVLLACLSDLKALL